MSRIPKVGFGASTGNKALYKPTQTLENKPAPSITKKTSGSNILSGFKRPSEEYLSLNGKRQKSDLNGVVKKNVLNTIQPSNSKVSKRVAALKPIPDSGIRSSMPAVISTGNVPGKSRRPAWDLKGRIQDMEENFLATQSRNAILSKELEDYNQRIAALETANSNLCKDVQIKSVQSEEASTKLRQLEIDLKKKTEEYEAASCELNNLKNMYYSETTVLKNSITSLTCLKSGLQAELDAAELMLQKQSKELLQLRQQNSDKDSLIESLLQKVSNYEAKIREEETLRRKLHNTVLELKGNIRVFCRLRPPLPEEEKNGMNVANIVPVSNKTIEIQQLTDIGLNEEKKKAKYRHQKKPELKYQTVNQKYVKERRILPDQKSGGKMQPKYEFSFDCFFPSYSSQKEVFSEISQLVQSAIDGYNVCIFAYGQTGSGKTFTMEGPSNIVDFVANKDHPDLGMIPRSVQQIFSSITELEPKGWKYKIETLFLEIYNERIQDLLNNNSNAKCEIVKSGSKGTDCVISNVKASEVSSAEQVYELMKKARINRAVAGTKCNEYSSRSHYVFQMKIYGENSVTGEKCDGILNLVDLAGSERVKDSESAGERLTEAKAINKSLSNLGKVIMSLSKKENHVPYRDSKLTHLLANSLGGNSKTLMFVNISPDNKNLSETINSLRFATKVNQCNIGTAQKRVK